MYPATQNLDFDSLESMCAAAATWDWGLDFIQLDGGICKSRFQRVDGEVASALRLEVGRRILQRGEAPPGLITFGIAANCIGDMSWNIRDVDSAMLLEFATGSEFEGISSSGFVCYTMNFTPEKLAAVAEIHGINVCVDQLGVIDRVTPIDRNYAPQFLRVLDQVFRQPAADSSGLRALLDDCVPVMLLTALEEARRRSGTSFSTTNIGGFKVARDYLEAMIGEPLNLNDLSKVSGLNIRTLQRSFRRYLDVTPREYLRVFRLKRAREDLLAIGTLDSVSGIALRNGFTHLGRFSAEYRHQFGELPSQTLRRSYRAAL